jgi:hypothetical protein
MAKMSKTAKKRLAEAIQSKTFKLYQTAVFTISDMDKINAICKRALGRIK